MLRKLLEVCWNGRSHESLQKQGWQVIDFLALLRGITAPESSPKRAVLCLPSMTDTG